MKFRLLGPVRAFSGDAPVELGDRKQRLVLAVLLLEANHLVPLNRLVRVLWPVRPPPSARRTVQTHVSRLRGILDRLRECAPESRLTRAGDGYLLSCAPDRIDAHQFRIAVEEARRTSDDLDRARILRQALALWHGPALADVATDEVRDELCGWLDESRLAAQEERFDAELRLGLQDQVMDDLTDLTARYPYRQRLVGQLMLALHQAGRTADALRVYAATRGRLIEELGLEPSAELQRTHLRVLRGERHQAAPTGSRTLGATSVARPPTRPGQLPADLPDFVGRRAPLRQLDAAVSGSDRSGAAPVVVISGMAGVGKSALATHWAHGVADRYPDGQLYVDLRGHAPTPPLTDVQALTAMLVGLGVPAGQAPTTAPDAAALYRSLLVGRRMLVLLDDAPGSAVVRALLPGSASCTVLVTSRNRLVGLVARNGAVRVELPPLLVTEAVELAGQALGRPAERSTEGAAVVRLVQLCGRLPLAIRIAAAQAADRSHGAAAQVEDMTGAELMDLLQIAGDEEAGVPAAFGRSVATLPPAAAAMFQVLAHAGPACLPIRAAARVAGITPAAAHRALRQLVDANLAHQRGVDLFGVPELLRRYAFSHLSQPSVTGGETTD